MVVLPHLHHVMQGMLSRLVVTGIIFTCAFLFNGQTASAQLISIGNTTPQENPGLVVGLLDTVDTTLDSTLGTLENTLPVLQPVTSSVQTLINVNDVPDSTSIPPLNPDGPNGGIQSLPEDTSNTENENNSPTRASAPVATSDTNDAPDENEESQSFFGSVASGLGSLVNWLAAQPIGNIAILLSLFVLGLIAAMYTIFTDWNRVAKLRRDGMHVQRIGIVSSAPIMATASLLAIGTGIFYIVMMYL